MTSFSLARSYFTKARKRLRALQTLLEDEAYSDVVREAQELVELALKGMLRFVGVEPPKRHDVGDVLLQHRERLPAGRPPPPIALPPSRRRSDRSGSSPSTATTTSSPPTNTRGKMPRRRSKTPGSSCRSWIRSRSRTDVASPPALRARRPERP